MAEGWTEERLDDLKGQVERLERRTDEGFCSLREEMDRRFDQAGASVDARFEVVDQRFDNVDKRLDRIDGRFEALDGRLYAMHRTLLVFLASMFAGLLGLLAAFIATQS